MQRANIINFDMIHHQYYGDKLSNPVNYYKTVKKHDLQNFEKKEKEKSLAALARCERKYLWVQRDLMIKYFKTFS